MPRTYVALDLETTGLSPDRDAIIEIGAVKFRDDQVLDTWSSLVNPQRPIPYKIEQLTGITSREVSRAPTIESLLEPLRRFVGRHPLVGHNIVNFDLKILRRYRLFLDNLPIDTFELAGILLPHAARYSLGKLAEALGIAFPNRHRALDDALATKDLFLALLRQASSLDPAVIREINRLAARVDWPLREVFRQVEREQARNAFTGAIGQQLRAKGLVGKRDVLGLILSHEDEIKPLRPAGRRTPLDVDQLTALLEEGGAFAQQFPGYEYRPPQVQMLRAVARAFNEGRHLLVEAGTGIGKSVAYLLPAVHFAVQNGERVVISTNTINLQDQLFNKDIPDLRKILPFEFRACVLKGRNNYLCQRRLAALRHSGLLQPIEMRVLAKILVWLPHTRTGDKGELFLPSTQEQAVWRRVCSEAEACAADRCPYRQRNQCFFYRARQVAEGSHLIVVNHALLLADVAVENRVLPEYRYLIVDEAHHLEDATTKQLSFEVNQATVERLLREVGSGQSDAKRFGGILGEVLGRCRGKLPRAIEEKLTAHIKQLQRETEQARLRLYDFFNDLTLFLESHSEGKGQYDRRVRLEGGMRAQPAWSNVEIVWDNLSAHLLRLSDGLEQLAGGLGELTKYDIPDAEDLRQELAGLASHLATIREQAEAIVTNPSPREIYWAQIGARSNTVSLHAAPLHVGNLVQRHLFLPKECVILTSATLRTDGTFSFIRERLGADEVDEVAFGSPFDFERQVLLYLPTDIPEPRQPYYQKTVEKTLVELARATRGRMLVLFTSYSQLRATSKVIAPTLVEDGIVVFSQGDGTSRAQLLENFRTTERAVLLGTRSFWEGIDVMGEALSCLVIARLPFSVPSDPVFAARAETFADPFGEYSVPETILRFRQGFGRLIRSSTDRGVVVVLDKRLLTKRYGVAFLHSLPQCTVRRGPLVELPRLAAAWIDGGPFVSSAEDSQ
ncbi:MAG: DEAD/DEAH box helicase family protein [Anaerolineae bacterium]|nr:DEAD/DEAH box helicase family protein [Anaerolineae bacterium]